MKVLIFDFDGTIADSFETLLGIFEEITNRPERLTASEIKDLRGKSLKEIIRYLKIRSWQIPRLILKAKGLIASRITTIQTFAGMPKALEKLHSDGYQMFILSTNSSANISEFLKANSLEQYFTKIYGDIGLRSKASALKKIMRKEMIGRADCVYIGDEVRDIEAAKKAGINALGVGWGFNYPQAVKSVRPDAFAAKPADLLKALQ